MLRYWEDMSYEEIAETMDVTVAAIKSRLFRARQQLAAIYQEREAAAPPPPAQPATAKARRTADDRPQPTMLRLALASW